MKSIQSVRSMLRWPFGGLYWRLTVSYFLVALVAVLSFTAYASLNPLIASAGGSAAPSPLERLNDKTTVPELASYLEQSPPDHEALNGWAWDLLAGVRIPLGTVTLVQVLDVGGQPLVSFAPAGTPTAALLSTPEAQAVLHAAQLGDQESATLRRELPDGQSVLAVPILTDGPNPRLVGIFLAVCTSTSLPPTKVVSHWLAPYLAQQPPNLDALRGWLWAEAHTSGDASGSIEINTSALLVQVLGADGEPLVSAVAPGISAESILASPDAQAALKGALAGHSQSTSPTRAGSQTRAVTVVPLRAYDGRLLGALLVAYNPSGGAFGLDLQGVWHDFLGRLSTGFLFLLMATLVGTFAGAVFALGLRRRLRRITAAADAWSQGELRIEVHDRSPDELGQLARHLNTMADQLHTLLAARQELAVVEERNRLARELHDSVKQHVFATALLVRSAQKQLERSPQTASGHLAEAEALAEQTQQELTTLIRALRPAALADKGLVAVLREYTSDWSRRTNIRAELRIQGERATPLELEEALYRVAQEALANVARHSKATAVEMHLIWEGDTLRLAIHDDGQGFDPVRAAGTGLGLASMRERVEAVGGTLAIESAPGGTAVAALAPLAARQTTEAMEATHG
jgi:signal transduction histidine kinase